jgi:lipopolysaccharide/colanic/teichoic acid biosynthesis glycosyltransferase
MPRWKTLLFWLIALLTASAIWRLTLIFVRLDFPIRWWSLGLGFGLLQTLLAYALTEGLLPLPLPRKWAYRLGFLLPFGWGLFLWWGHPFGWFLLLVDFLASFLGSLIATRQHIGFWEDNQPPSPEMCETVHRLHREIIGEPPSVPPAKRVFDVLLSTFGLLLSAPVWLLALFVIWFDDPGPLFFVKNSVGRGGITFHQYKLRTMERDAERATGPVMASEDDSRALRSGRFLRKTALDELPQLFNILRGEMSFVGPRPQRTVLVYGYLQTMPEFAERHRVLPGLAGLAQVAGSYYITPRQKLRYDRIYARHASLGFDLKLIALAFALVFYLRWRPGSGDRIPRGWLH